MLYATPFWYLCVSQNTHMCIDKMALVVVCLWVVDLNNRWIKFEKLSKGHLMVLRGRKCQLIDKIQDAC